MEINIKGDPKEIAVLVVELQGRRSVDVKLDLNGETIAKSAFEAIRGKHEA